MTTPIDSATLTDEMFSGEQIAEAIGNLASYDKYTDVATLINGEYGPAVLKAFAELARTLGLPVTIESYRMAIRTEKPIEDQRRSAIQSLRYRAERGEIEPAYLYGRPGDLDGVTG